MDKKIFGIRIGTYFTILLSLICALIFWLYVNIVPQDSLTSVTALGFNILSLLC